MKRNEALERIGEIRRIAERTTLYTLLPGVPAVVGGLLALAGCAASYAMINVAAGPSAAALGPFDFGRILWLPITGQVTFCVMWTVVGAAAILQDVLLTGRAARRLGVEPVGRPGRFAALSLSPSVLVAAVLTARFLSDIQSTGDPQIHYIAPVWMMCYGTGIYAAGLFSVRLPRMLGLAFLLLGALTLLVPGYGLLMVALSFGGLHLLFGAVVLAKARRDGADG
jgi:hypothetical protein